MSTVLALNFNAIKIVERHHTEQHDADDALVGGQITPGDMPGDPQRDRRHDHGEKIVSPHFVRDHGEPAAHQPRGERRMLRRAEPDLVRPRHHLAHVEVDVLAAFGDGRVKRPHRGIAREQQRHGALAARRID
jgi:hypothetical protein